MTIAQGWSKRVSRSVLPYLPRLSITSILHLKKTDEHYSKLGAASDTSSVTAISYPQGSIARKSAKLRAYIHQISQPLFRRFKPQPKNPEANLDLAGAIRPATQLPHSPPAMIAATSPPLSPASDSTALSSVVEDREIRAEQDAALEQAQRADREFIERLMEARRQEAERERLFAELEERRRIQEERRRIQEEKEMIYRRAQNHWRRWARRALIPSDPYGKGIKVAVRLPSGQRRVGILPADASLEVLHTLVETFLIPPEHPSEDDPEQPPEGWTHCWEFSLVTNHERVVLPKDCELQIGGLDMLKQGVLLIVEEHANRGAVEDDTEME